MNKLHEIARQQQCDVMMLDAYLHNTRAHAFYEKAGLKAKGYHFIKKVSADDSTHECMQ
jgi:ribosomal protein S18 acetylase RimI-like enzyme